MNNILCKSALLLAILHNLPAMAEEPANKTLIFETLWPAVCSSSVNKLLQTESLKPIQGTSSLSPDILCSCITQKMKSSPITSKIFLDDFEGYEVNFKEKAEAQHYLNGRAFLYTVECMGPGIEAATDALITKK